MDESLYQVSSELDEAVVPYKDGTVKFAGPPVGPATYQTTGKLLHERGLRAPTAEETVALVHAAYCGPEESFRNTLFGEGVRAVMKDYLLRVPNVNLWVPEGVYVLHDADMRGKTRFIEGTFKELNAHLKCLEDRLVGGTEVGDIRFSPDGAVRFAPKQSYITNHFGPDLGREIDLATNGFIIASYGLDGAKQLEEVSKRIGGKSIVSGWDEKVGAMDWVSDLSETSQGLYVSGDALGNWGDAVGFTFGVRD